MNSESEMQAKIAIAAALIAAGTYDMGLVHMHESNALGQPWMRALLVLTAAAIVTFVCFRAAAAADDDRDADT